MQSGLRLFTEDGPILRFFQSYGIESIIQPLLRRVLDLRHGGTIFFVPPAISINNLCDIRYCFARAEKLLSISLTRCKELPPSDGRESYSLGSARQLNKGTLEDGIEMVAGMTAIDGALVLGTDLSVFGFGGLVRNIENPPRAFRARDAMGGEIEEYDLSQRGTRHRSAICFCGDCPGALAIVVSQDGTLSAMIARANVPNQAKRNAVVIWNSIELESSFTAPPA
jgi:hypothetical protein